MAATESFSWPDAAGAAVVAFAVVALVGFAVAAFVQMRTVNQRRHDLREPSGAMSSWRRTPSMPSSARPQTSPR